jgi:hypothetical protein
MTPSNDEHQTTPLAPGQYLGYSLQATRFLMRLLDAPAGWTVSLEVFEDVGVETGQGNRIAEQDKSSLEANPVSDRAVDLWKTLSNWLDAAQSGELNPETTKFVLYVSHPKTGEIVESFARARSSAEAREALLQAREKLWGPSSTFPFRPRVSRTIAPYVDKIFEADEHMICRIIQNFQFESGSGSPQEDLRAVFATRLIPPEIVDDALAYALGWVKENTDRLIEQKKWARISVESFQAAIVSFVRKHDNRTILNTFATKPSHEQIQHDLRIRTYVRQLDMIEADDEQKIRAVTDFLRASVDRTQWSAKGLVHASSFDEFEEGLVRTWDNHKRKTEIKFPAHSDVQKGQYLYLECSSHQATLEGLQVPPHFTPGSFHALADEPVIGWHPHYRRELGVADSEGNS